MTVLVMGEALMDITVGADVKQLSPGGSPANVALGLGRLGVDVTLHTALGEDDFGRQLLEHLGRSGVRLTSESWRGGRTSSAVATIGADGAAAYTFDVTWDPAPVPDVRATVLHVGSIAAVLEPGASRVLDAVIRAKSEGTLIAFDPNVRPTLIENGGLARERVIEIVRLSDVVKLSDEDAAWLFPGAGLDVVLDRLLQAGPAVAALTCGADGSVVVSDGHRVEQRAVGVDAVDTIGAGDTFMAALIVKVLESFESVRGRSELSSEWLADVADFASHAAAVTVGRAGADLPWASELDARARPNSAG